ncbi:MAG: 2-dehydropantoate 2-reductase [Pseudomonadota bacterium]
MARIAIVGPGALGGVMAAWLSRHAAHEIILCARRPLDGLVVETPGETITVPATVFTDPKAVPAADWVLVATKTYDVPGAAAWLKPLCATGAPVAILQNGVEHRELFSPYLPAERLLPVLAYCPAERTSPTRIQQRRKARLVVPDNALGRDFAALFAGTPVEVSCVPDFTSAAWEKLCVNAVGAINALLLQPAGVLREEAVAELARQLMRECIAVGRAESAALDDTLVERVLELYRNNPADSINSLHADRLAGRPMEIDARNGVIVRLGRKHGIPTPCNEMAVTLLEALTRGTKI